MVEREKETNRLLPTPTSFRPSSSFLRPSFPSNTFSSSFPSVSTTATEHFYNPSIPFQPSSFSLYRPPPVFGETFHIPASSTTNMESRNTTRCVNGSDFLSRPPSSSQLAKENLLNGGRINESFHLPGNNVDSLIRFGNISLPISSPTNLFTEHRPPLAWLQASSFPSHSSVTSLQPPPFYATSTMAVTPSIVPPFCPAPNHTHFSFPSTSFPVQTSLSSSATLNPLYPSAYNMPTNYYKTSHKFFS